MTSADVVEQELATWVFLGGLAAATAAVLGFYGRTISAWQAPEPRTDLVSPGHFGRMRGVEQEVDLGTGWRSTDDPRAAWHLWWLPTTGDIVPGPVHLGSYHGRTLLDPVGVHHFTGMKVLGHSGDRPTRAGCEALRLRTDGLDLLTGGTRRPAPAVDDGIDDGIGELWGDGGG
ncbi:MAG: hypothetical protein MUE36_15110 [Acidimicrobiales bacterium]|nr:hypothetical protein [Acidimicrobiales bacterium]